MGKRKVDPEIARQKAQTANAVRHGHADADERRAALRALVLSRHIQKAVATAPPFTPEQIDRLRSLLPPVQENELTRG